MTRRSSRGLLVYAIIFVAILYLPVLFLPIFSVNDSITPSFPYRGFTLQWYSEMVTSPGLTAALGNSLKVAFVVSLVSTCFGVLAAIASTQYRLKGRRLFSAMILAPMVIPLIVLGTSGLIVSQLFGTKLSLATVAIAHTVICIPFSMMVMSSRLEGFDRSLLECSGDLGENAWVTFWRVTFWLALPGIVASLLLTFTVSFDEFVLASFLAGSQPTLPLYIWSQLRFPNKLPSVLCLATVIMMVSLLLVSVAQWLRRDERSRKPAPKQAG